MTDIATDLIALTRLAPEPLRSEDAATALGIEVAAVEVTGEALVADGVLAFEDGGFVVGPRAQTAPASPIRETHLAVALAEALEARHADPGEVGLLYARAARWERARDPLAEAALQTTTDGERAAHLAGLALEAESHVPGLGATTRGRLHLTRARHLRATGRSHEAMQALDSAVHLLGGVERVDALGFATVVADDLQSPQWAETLAALAESEAWSAGEPAKAGSLLTLRARMLGRIGFPREADRVLEVGTELLHLHGHEIQRFYAHLNRARVQLDRGEARHAEAGFDRLREEAKAIEGPISQADKEVYWARAAFATGHPAEALEAVERVEAAADQHDAPVLAFLAAIARAEGALYFERFDEALEESDRVLDLAMAHQPVWENRARVLRARALVGLGLLERASAETAAARAATPEGIDGLRLRKEIEVAELLAIPPDQPWPKQRAEDLTDELLHAQWHLPALELMIERARREGDDELALQAAGLSLDLGIPTEAIRAGHTAGMWDEPAGQEIAFAAQSVSHHLPERWAEDWQALVHVSAALTVEVTDDAGAAEELTARWAEVVEKGGLAGYEVLSPAQRRIRGLVRRRAGRSWARRVLAATGVAAVAAAVSIAMFVVLRDPPETTTTTIAQATVIPIEGTELSRPEARFSGQFSYQVDPGRSGFVPDAVGVPEATGYYWKNPPTGRIYGTPVIHGVHAYVATVDAIVAIDLTDGTVSWQYPTAAEVRSTPAVAVMDQAGRGGQGGNPTFVAFGDSDGTVSFRDAAQTGGGLLHRESLEGRIVGAPLVIGAQFIFASSSSGHSEVVAISPVDRRVDWRYSGTDDVPLGEVRAAPSFADGIVYVATTGPQGRLHMIDATNGSHLCETAPLGSIDYHPIVVDGIAYLATSEGVVYTRAAGDCDLRQIEGRKEAYSVGSRISGPPAIAGNVMVIPGGSRLVAIELTDLDQRSYLWNFPSGGDILSAPVIAGEIVYFGNDAGTLYALALHADQETGEELWHWEAGSAIQSPVAVLNGLVLYVSIAGDVVAIGGA